MSGNDRDPMSVQARLENASTQLGHALEEADDEMMDDIIDAIAATDAALAKERGESPDQLRADGHGVDLPPGHLLRGHEDKLDTHAGHLEAYSEILAGFDPDAVRGVMLVVEHGNATDTLPTVAPDVDAESVSWHMLASHLHHVADSLGARPWDVAKHTIHVLEDMLGGPDER